MDYRTFLTGRCNAVEFSGIRKIFDRAGRGGKNVIDLSLGQPDYDAPEAVKLAAIDAIRSGKNRYTPTAGLPALREKLAERLRREYSWDPALLISSGVSGGLTLALLATVGEADEVVFVDPYFVSYTQLVRLVGGTPVAVSSYPDFTFPAAAIERAITPRTKLLLINSPANPTGRVMTPSEAQAAADIARRHDVLLVCDEIYHELTYDGPNPSPLRWAPERTILLRGFGKTFGITGWRLGYVAAPPALVEEMMKMQQYTFVCAPSFAQHAVLDALDTDVSGHRRDYAKKRDLALRLLTPAFEIVKPSGGFYIFPKVPARYPNATAFCEMAAARDVMVIPGAVFSGQDTHFRISYAAPDDTLARGCEILAQLAQGARS